MVVSDVKRGSPGEAAGVRAGDELVRVGAMDVTNPLDVERAFLDSRPGRPDPVLVRRDGIETAMNLEVRPAPDGATLATAAEPIDAIWDSLGIRTAPATGEDVAAVNPKLRGGLFIQAIAPESPFAAAALEQGDILVGMNVGGRAYETIRPDNILYVLRQPEAAQTQSALLYVIRRGGGLVDPQRISLSDPRVQTMLAR